MHGLYTMLSDIVREEFQDVTFEMETSHPAVMLSFSAALISIDVDGKVIGEGILGPRPTGAVHSEF